MNTDTLEIVMPFLKDMIICEGVENSTVSFVNKFFHREFKDTMIRIALLLWTKSEESSVFFYENTISESVLSHIRLNDNIIYFNLFTGNRTVGREKHKVSMSVENGSVIISISTHHFIDDSPDLLPEDDDDKFYVRKFTNIKTFNQFKQTFKHIWLENAYFIESPAYNLQSILEGDGDRCKYVCFNE